MQIALDCQRAQWHTVTGYTAKLHPNMHRSYLNRDALIDRKCDRDKLEIE
jgi:hypothetical protein